jgi:hypothetical protein
VPSCGAVAADCAINDMMCSSLMSSLPQRADDSAFLSTTTWSEPSGELLELGGDHDDAQALLGQLVDECLHLGLGADVDAAGRLVQAAAPWG